MGGVSERSVMGELADELQMLASGLKEHVENQENLAPSPWRFDDWFARYRGAWRDTHGGVQQPDAGEGEAE